MHWTSLPHRIITLLLTPLTPCLSVVQLRAIPTDPKQEELQSQVVRLKRQRDKLSRDNQELAHALQDTQDALSAAHCQLTNVQVCLPCVQCGAT
jgi:outer membrane murein-binding lipoprotein Lpp